LPGVRSERPADALAAGRRPPLSNSTDGVLVVPYRQIVAIALVQGIAAFKHRSFDFSLSFGMRIGVPV
jgi:hypothetical protein